MHSYLGGVREQLEVVGGVGMQLEVVVVYLGVLLFTGAGSPGFCGTG